MTDDDAPVQVYVAYEGSAADRFDRDHYVNHHLPLVIASWAKHGLESARAFFPADNEAGTVAVCECRFRNEAAVDAAFSSVEAPTVMADVPLFTDLEPRRMRTLAL